MMTEVSGRHPPPAVRPARPEDAPTLVRMRCALWSDGDEVEHRRELERFFAGLAREPQAILVAQGATGAVIGFVELALRPCAEGCRTDRVAYVEGWWVAPEARRRGVGRTLVAAAEAWGRAQGCTELASDARHDNAASIAAHSAVGFADAGLVRCFRKDL